MDRAGGGRGRRDEGGVSEDDVRQPCRVDGQRVEQIPRYLTEDHDGVGGGGRCIMVKIRESEKWLGIGSTAQVAHTEAAFQGL